jgi:predicted phage terminase large subunit-like protein
MSVSPKRKIQRTRARRARNRPGPEAGLQLRALDAACRTDFATFIGKCCDTLSPGRPFFPNWHISAFAHNLERVRNGEIKRLIITAPPRSLKSIASSVALPAYMLGHDPTRRLIVVSYSADLAIKHANDFRQIVTAQWYRRVFPNMRISRTKNTEFETVTTQGGYRLATSVDGTVTGRGGDVLIVDDPQKPTDGDARREHVNLVFNKVLLSRLDDQREGAMIVVMQRIHPDDLAGRILRTSPEEWTQLNIPAIAEQEEAIEIGFNKSHTRRIGESFHPDRCSISDLERTRGQIGPEIFAAQFQQAPVPPGGTIVKREWVQRYDQLPNPSSCVVLQSWDTATKDGVQNDYSVCTTWLHHENKNYFLKDVLRDRFDYPTLKALAITHARQQKPHIILVEDAGIGTALVLELKAAGLQAIAVKPEYDKKTRMAIQSGKFESGHVFFPKQASWLADLELELFAFPFSLHDDQVDSISQALAHKMSSYGWNKKSIEGLSRFTEAMMFERFLRGATGAPW